MSLIAVLLTASAWAQTRPGTTARDAVSAPPGAPSTYVVPRTPWVDPDLQGIWPANDMHGTPYERPAELGTRATLTDAEFNARQQARQRQSELEAEPVVVDRPRTNAGAAPPSHWGERGKPSRRASLVVDPPDGRLPPMTEEGKKRIAAARSTYWYDFPDAVVQHPFEILRQEHPERGAHDREGGRRGEHGGALDGLKGHNPNQVSQVFDRPFKTSRPHEVRARDTATSGAEPAALFSAV
jgi:hypothetical protein